MHHVSDRGSGAAIKMGRRSGGWRTQGWEGSRPRPAAAGSFPKPRAFPDQRREYTLGFENAFEARGDPTSPGQQANKFRAQATSDRQRALPVRGLRSRTFAHPVKKTRNATYPSH